MNNKWLIFDMDGTLLNDNYILPKLTNEFLFYAYEKGYKLAIATGRPYFAIKENLPPKTFNLLSLTISYNGSRIDYNGKTHFNKVNVNLIEKLSGKFAITISGDDGSFYIDKKEYATEILKRYKTKVKDLKDFKNSHANHLRLVFKSKNEAKKTFNWIMSKKWNIKYVINLSTSLFILITKKHSSKGSAINKVLGSDANITFFGDSDNDLSAMILPNVKSVTPSNGNFNCKKIADIILKNDNNKGLWIDLD
ncbi:MAG: Cof-type HAD-IIB family hydrolase [Mollicutes bacterium PWAP]|nr:Cof-type HAD-IIB family hydrolase [Mollicutes bacterium PWAP]